MRTKLLILTLVLASLACTANVSILNPVVTPTSQSLPTAGADATPSVSVPTFEGFLPVVPSEISKIQMMDAQNGWIITATNVLRTIDGGATWYNVTPSTGSIAGSGAGASFLGANVAWILIGDPQQPLNSGLLYHTSDGGLTWVEYGTPFGSGELHFLDTRNGWVMIVAGAGAGNMPVLFYQTTDGGVNWRQVYSNLPGDTSEQTSLPVTGIKSGFTPVSMQEAWVAGQTSAPNVVYLYHTTDGGHTWAAVDPKLPFGGEAQYLTHPPVFFGSQTGLLPTMAGSEGSGTFFFITEDGGKTWTTGAGVPGSGFTSVVSPNDVFIFFSGVIFVSHDATQTWTSVTPNVALNSSTVNGFQFVDTQTGWIVLSDASGHTSLYKTTDGGQTWAAQVQ
jgi:photosystem II stability/assembly factor-like uncharacterized protein